VNRTSQEILIVEDSPDVAEVISEVLASEGYQTRIACNGRAALEAVRERRPALVITDGMMPEMTGLDLITALRSDLPPPVPPTIVLSGFPALEREALERGATTFLHKPIAIDELLDAVAHVFSHEPTSPAAVERSRRRASEARRALSEDAAAFFAKVEANGEAFRASTTGRVSWLVRYFGFGTGVVVALFPDSMELLTQARAPGSGPLDLAAGDLLLRDIAETRSSLLVKDTMRYQSLCSMASTGSIRFFAGVPFLAPGGTIVGAFALMDAEPRPFTADDLGLLEYVSRRGSARIEALVRDHGVPEYLLDDAGLLDHAGFQTFLSAELRLAEKAGDGVAIGMLDFEGELPPCLASDDGPRLGIGRLSPQRLGGFKRHASADRAAAVLATALEGYRRGAGRSPAVVLALAAPMVASMSAEMATCLVENALAEARRRGGTLNLSLSVVEPAAAPA
jgi:CheY-like chemotaxis protein